MSSSLASLPSKTVHRRESLQLEPNTALWLPLMGFCPSPGELIKENMIGAVRRGKQIGAGSVTVDLAQSP